MYETLMTMALEDDLDVRSATLTGVFVKREKPGNPSPRSPSLNRCINRPGLAADGASSRRWTHVVWMGVYRRDVIVKITLNLLPDYIIRILSGQQNHV